MTVSIAAVETIDANRISYATWAGMADTNVGLGVIAIELNEISVVAIGDATSVAMTGSNDNGTTWSALDGGVTLTMASNKTPITRISTHPYLIRPEVTGGTSTKVILVGKKNPG